MQSGVRWIILFVRLAGITVATVATIIMSAGAARADAMCTALDAGWPRVPDGHAPSMGQMVTDGLTGLGNEIGHHMNVLSHDVLSMEFDGRNKRASVRVGAGDAAYASFSIATDIKFSGDTARIKATIDVSVYGKRVKFELPEFEMMPQSYQGDRVVVLLVPVVERRW